MGSRAPAGCFRLVGDSGAPGMALALSVCAALLGALIYPGSISYMATPLGQDGAGSISSTDSTTAAFFHDLLDRDGPEQRLHGSRLAAACATWPDASSTMAPAAAAQCPTNCPIAARAATRSSRMPGDHNTAHRFAGLLSDTAGTDEPGNGRQWPQFYRCFL